MAQNLRRKLPPSDTLIVYDVRKEVVDQFASEEGEGGGSMVEGVKTLEEIVNRAVSVHCPSFALCVCLYGHPLWERKKTPWKSLEDSMMNSRKYSNTWDFCP